MWSSRILYIQRCVSNGGKQLSADGRDAEGGTHEEHAYWVIGIL